jgi:hypothetical protein
MTTEVQSKASLNGIAIKFLEFKCASQISSRFLATLAPSEIAIAKHTWGNYYVGTGDALVAAGIVTADMLPGQPGRNKTCVTIGRQRHRRVPPDYVQIKKLNSKHFAVDKGISDVERLSREHANERAKLAEQERNFRRQAEYSLQLFFGALRNTFLQDDGFGYSDKTLAEFECLADQIEHLILNSEIAYSLDGSDRVAAASMREPHKDDKQLQGFLQFVTKDCPLLQGENPEE